MRPQRGQASLEVVLFIPLLVVVVAAIVQVLAAGSARTDADAAAEAGAVALLQDADPRQAMERALGDAAGRADLVIDDHRVRVTVRPRAFAPLLADLLAATAQADAGEEGSPARRIVVRGGDGESARPKQKAP